MRYSNEAFTDWAISLNGRANMNRLKRYVFSCSRSCGSSAILTLLYRIPAVCYGTLRMEYGTVNYDQFKLVSSTAINPIKD